MNVFKFGGASVDSAEGVRNFVKIVQNYKEEMIIVVSAMGKMTNALEDLAHSYFHGHEDTKNRFLQIKNYHLEIITGLFSERESKGYEELEQIFLELEKYLEKTPSLNYDFEYDQIVSFGELLSTKIISLFLTQSGRPNKWVDIRSCLKTDDTHREARVDWELSSKLINQVFNFEKTFVYITQGFIGGTNTNMTTTLGREGSDYTAAILSYILDCDRVMIWKDVPGIMNADPKWLDDAQKLERISYREAIELAFYGAKVIHPKTIQPLKKKEIPLHVKSFKEPSEPGTIIAKANNKREEHIPVFIQKKNQLLISIQPNDFSFIMEENLSDIFSTFAKYRVKVNLTQNSAISFSVCVDDTGEKLRELIVELKKNYRVRYNEHQELITIRHYNREAVERMVKGREILMEQRSRNTAQYVLSN
ncbi:MAG: aspartate kinase [Marinifilaceae bacterium]